MSKDNQEIILITRADDMGYTHTGNIATIECMRNGIIKLGRHSGHRALV